MCNCSSKGYSNLMCIITVREYGPSRLADRLYHTKSVFVHLVDTVNSVVEHQPKPTASSLNVCKVET